MTATILTGPPAAFSEPTLTVAAGRVLTLAGAVFGLSNLFQYGVQSGLLHLHPAVLGLSWPVAVAAFLIGLRRLRASGGEAGRRAAGWSRYSIGAMILSAMTLLTASVLSHDFTLMLWMTPLGMGLYAVAWTIAVVRGRRLWMAVPAVGSIVAAGVAVSLLGTPQQYLAYAAGLLLFVLIPGALMATGRKA